MAAAKLAALKHDANLTRVGPLLATAGKSIWAGTGRYFISKVPIVEWIPVYVPQWLVGDVLAGASTGIIMVPLAELYAGLMGVPVQTVLTSCWLPGLLYTMMGTSREISTGPALMTSLITGGVIHSVSADGRIPAVLVAPVLSFCVSIWCLIFGVLRLGFIFDFLSLPQTLGLGTGLAIVAWMAQLPTLFGIEGVNPMLTHVLGEMLPQLPKTNPRAFGIAATTMVILIAAQIIEKKFSYRHPAIKALTNSRNFVVLILYTFISYMFNKDSKEPLWPIVGDVTTQITSFQVPNMQLVKSLLLPSISLFIPVMMEHVLLAKSLARTRGYKIDASQEVLFLGLANLGNSLMGGAPVSGSDMSRAGVSNSSGVRTPLSNIFASIATALCMYPASGAIKWLPKGTAGAVIIVAVFHSQPPMDNIGKYWKISFADFGGFLSTFNITMIMTPEMGVGIGLAIMVMYTLFRYMFKRPRTIETKELERLFTPAQNPQWKTGEQISPSTMVITFDSDLFFLNYDRFERHVVDKAMTRYIDTPSMENDVDRVWNVRVDKRVRHLRKQAGMSDMERYLPHLEVVILDLSAASFIDASGLQAIEDVKREIRAYAGSTVEFRFVGLSKAARRRFERAGWALSTPEDENESRPEEIVDLVFDSLPRAIEHIPQRKRMF